MVSAVSVNPDRVFFMKLKSLKTSVIVSSIAVLGVGSAMAMTNPPRQEYQTYAAKRMGGYLKEEVCTDAPDALGGFLQKQCNNIVERGQKPMADWVDRSTERQNYVLFSIYETELSIMAGLPSYEFKTIGIFQNFWIYHKKEK